MVRSKRLAPGLIQSTSPLNAEPCAPRVYCHSVSWIKRPVSLNYEIEMQVEAYTNLCVSQTHGLFN